MAFHEARRVSSANTVGHLGRVWRISPTLKKTVWLVIHPDIRFWVVESRPDPLNPAWPTILASYTL
jgi:hypothetical protein